MRTRVAYATLVVAAVVMLAPVVVDRDSYPGSTYPMFARDRGHISAVATAVGIDEHGEVLRLTPNLIGGSDEVVLAVETVLKAVRAGPAAADDLCERVARRVARAGLPAVLIEIRVETLDAVRWFTDDDRTPLQITRHAECAVEG